MPPVCGWNRNEMAADAPRPDGTVSPFLRGERIGFRAPSIEDAAVANVWMIDAKGVHAGGVTFPVTRERAEKQLREEEVVPWGNSDTIRLVAVELETDEILGGAVILREQGRTGWIRSQVASWLDRDEADRVEIEMASILIRFAREEVDLMVIEYVVAGDRTALIDHIVSEGFNEGARLRKALRRPVGRADVLWLESVNPNWGSRIVASEEAG
jgi:hypothetical protein